MSGAALELDAPVAEVTLFEDRARVVRRGALRVETGEVLVRVAGVAPVLADAALVASVETDGGSASARVVDTRVRRRLVVSRPDGEAESELERLEEERRTFERDLRRLQARHGLQARDAAALAELGGVSLREIAEDVAWGREEAASWSERLDALSRKARAARERSVALADELGEARRTMARLDERIRALRNPAREQWAGLEAELVVASAGELRLRFEYVVPGACWRPYHRAELSADGTRVAFRTEGCVWQNTGEDWRDVRLAFSTQRPSLGTTPPELDSDVLRVQEKQAQVIVEAREQEVATTGLGAETATAERLPGIDDAGETVTLAAEAPATVPSDGRAYRVPLFGFESGAETDLVSVPERVQAAILRTRQVNRAPAPVLAGPVDLIRGGGFAGRSSLLYVAPGERFALGWGPEPELRVQRTVEVDEQKQAMLSTWRARRHRAIVRLSNIGSAERTLTVTERVPVSEIDKVAVEIDAGATSDGRRPDADGFVEWSVRLPPFGQRTLELAYTLKRREDVTGI